tara:strand:+ start:544 stop:810 length:267 start_codon:yes stop_codon:yes gene_type:complete
MTKKEDKEMEKQVEKLRDNFMYSLWDIIDDMYFADMNKQEITKLLIRDLKFGINTEYKILRSNHPNHIPCIVCEKTLKNVKKRVIKND